MDKEAESGMWGGRDRGGRHHLFRRRKQIAPSLIRHASKTAFGKEEKGKGESEIGEPGEAERRRRTELKTASRAG